MDFVRIVCQESYDGIGLELIYDHVRSDRNRDPAHIEKRWSFFLEFIHPKWLTIHNTERHLSNIHLDGQIVSVLKSVLILFFLFISDGNRTVRHLKRLQMAKQSKKCLKRQHPSR